MIRQIVGEMKQHARQYTESRLIIQPSKAQGVDDETQHEYTKGDIVLKLARYQKYPVMPARP